MHGLKQLLLLLLLDITSVDHPASLCLLPHVSILVAQLKLRHELLAEMLILQLLLIVQIDDHGVIILTVFEIIPGYNGRVVELGWSSTTRLRCRRGE